MLLAQPSLAIVRDLTTGLRLCFVHLRRGARVTRLVLRAFGEGESERRFAAALGAVRAAGSRMRDQRVVIHGAGTAGIGIADVLRQVMIAEGLSPDEATRCFYALGSKGLLTSDYPGTLRDFQVPYARPAAEVSGWPRDGPEVTYEAVKRFSVMENGWRSDGDTSLPGWNSSSAVTVFANAPVGVWKIAVARFQ